MTEKMKIEDSGRKTQEMMTEDRAEMTEEMKTEDRVGMTEEMMTENTTGMTEEMETEDRTDPTENMTETDLFSEVDFEMDIRSLEQLEAEPDKVHEFSDRQIDALIASLTLEEKIALCSGKNEWTTKEVKAPSGAARIPSVRVADGPHGLRKTVGRGDNMGLSGSQPATCFPAESLLACSFDRTMASAMGASIADEARAAGVCTVLGPGVNIKRNPLGGRNFEYLSEDPYLAGRMAAAYIQGVQGRGIGTSLKHFACNSQEYYRMLSDSRVSERTLREIYLSAFEYAIKTAEPATVMCAYNKLNGTSCSDNEFLLDTVLRKEWGYRGMVVSDWGALNDRVNAFRAGCDLIMPGGSAYGESEVKKAVLAGELPEELVDRSARRVASFALRQSALLKDAAGEYAEGMLPIGPLQERNHQVAQVIAENSAVLLKNEGSILPLTPPYSVGLIGTMAERFRFQGSGSSKINPTRRENLWNCLRAAFGEGAELPYAKGYDAAGDTTDEMIHEAVALAKVSDKVLLVVGLTEQYEAEGMDRHNMALPAGENRLVEEVTKVNPNVIVVLVSGCAVETPWISRVRALLWMGLSGQAGAAALTRILVGEVNPSGKLAESWPMEYKDCPSAEYYLKEGRDAEYREGWRVGYRYYDQARLAVRFPFGYGLSYTTFAYSDLKGYQRSGKTYASVKVTNTGSRVGKEAVLLYVWASQAGIDRPVRELKGFDKIELQPGESRVVEFELDTRTFAVWNDGWTVYEGVYMLDISGERKKIFIRGKKWDAEEARKAEMSNAIPEKKVPEETPDPEAAESDFDYEIIGPPAPDKYNVNSTITEVAEDVWLMRVVLWGFRKVMARTNGADSADYRAMLSVINECPLRTVQMFAGMKHHFAQALADLGNKHLLKAVEELLS